MFIYLFLFHGWGYDVLLAVGTRPLYRLDDDRHDFLPHFSLSLDASSPPPPGFEDIAGLVSAIGKEFGGFPVG